MQFLYYFRECPTCKNFDRNLIRQCALKTHANIDERYVLALPDIWGEEARALAADGAELPFIYCVESRRWLNIDHTIPEMADKLTEFLKDGGIEP